MFTVSDMVLYEEYKLSQKAPEALTPPTKKLPGEFAPGTCRIVGDVPAELRLTYSLNRSLDKRFAESKELTEQMELVALRAATEYKWNIKFAECCKAIEVPLGGEIRVLGDWSIAIINIPFMVRGSQE
ncbi:MAG TPA: hypothetical protein VMD74_04365 [Candidatus Methylomirabilis sp.]|nr:hypothetical protein [Candidatus Methylomirabilis sp.]